MLVPRFSASVIAGLLVLAFAACDDKKEPEVVDPGVPGPLTVDAIIADPKVGLPGDTLLFTAVITSSSQNLGDFPTMQWTATGGSFLETTQQTVRWVAPVTPGVFVITAKATNDVGSATGSSSLYVGSGSTLLTENAGQVEYVGGAAEFYFLRTLDVTRGVDVYQYGGAAPGTDVIPSPGTVNVRGHLNVVFSPDRTREAHAADSDTIVSAGRARDIIVGTFGTGTYQRLTIDTSRPGNNERNICNYPSFSPNGEVVAYQRFAQTWDGEAPDSFHVYTYDVVAQKRTLVTYDQAFPRGFFPTFSTDGNWLVYVFDPSRQAEWDLYASPMTGNDVDGAAANMIRFTNTGGRIVTAPARDLATKNLKPPMAWNPVSSVLAVSAADDALYLVATTASGATMTQVPDVNSVQEFAWSPGGSMLAATYSFTDDEGDPHAKIVTISPTGAVTDRVFLPDGDAARDLMFSPDENWLVYRVLRGGGSWFAAIDLTGTKLSGPVSITATDPSGSAGAYREVMHLRPAWTPGNIMIYPAFGSNLSDTPGVFTRDLNGLVN